jgi:hypothetical protein
MRPATGRPELERWLASAAFNAYFGFRLREFGAGECTIEIFVAGREKRIYAILPMQHRHDQLLDHHTEALRKSP